MANSFDVNTFTKGLQQLADLSITSLRSSLENSLRTMNSTSNIISSLTQTFPGLKTRKDDCGCCPPPKEECPPRCLINISRTAYAGERIVVPFSVRNVSNSSKTYLVGVRPLVDENGNAAPSQPQLNKTSVTLNPGQSELVIMTVDLANFSQGHSFQTDIVLREKDINQNICFSLQVIPFFDIPEAQPKDEKKYTSHFQGWQSHFYCDPPSFSRVPGTNLHVSEVNQ